MQDYENFEEERSDFIKDRLLKYVDVCVGVDEKSAQVGGNDLRVKKISLSACFATHTHTHTHTLSLSQSLTHTYTHYSHSHSLSLSLSLSLSHTHTHTAIL